MVFEPHSCCKISNSFIFSVGRHASTTLSRTATVSRHLLALLLSIPACHAVAAPAAGIVHAEQAALLVRDTGMFSAGRGVALRPGDLLDSRDGTIQLALGDAAVALGPGTRLFFRQGGEVVLLSGWLKAGGGATRPLAINATLLRFDVRDATAIVHATPAAAEIFAESGDLALEELDAGKAGRKVKLPREQFAVRSGAQATRVQARPAAPFLAGMPPGFRDLLVPLTQGPAALPKRERRATYAELAPWLAHQPALRQQVQRRFEPPRPARAAPATPAQSNKQP